jgi:hypothetical protein
LLGRVQSADDLQQGGLAGSTGADNRDDLALGDFKVNTPQHLQVAISLNYVSSFYHHIAICKGNKKFSLDRFLVSKNCITFAATF